MGGINRRNFIKNLAIGGAVLGLGNAVFKTPSHVLAGAAVSNGFQNRSQRLFFVCESFYVLKPNP